MSEYLQSEFVELNTDTNIIHRIMLALNVNQFDFVVAFIGFYIVRYVFPNSLLTTEQNFKTGIIIAFCYAIFGVIRSSIMHYKTRLEIIS